MDLFRVVYLKFLSNSYISARNAEPKLIFIRGANVKQDIRVSGQFDVVFRSGKMLSHTAGIYLFWESI